jgi:hypothetical protein
LVNDISFVLVFNAELCNNLDVMYFCRGQNLVLFFKKYAQIYCCRLGTFPFTYLGVLLHYDKLRREDIQPILDKIIKRVAGWKGKLLSYEARLTLLRACLASIPIYLMFVIKFSKWVVKAINFQMANFFFQK